MSSLAKAESEKAMFKTKPSANSAVVLISAAITAWNEVELCDEELAEYLELVAHWLRNNE